jgi:hypothetical protein
MATGNNEVPYISKTRKKDSECFYHKEMIMDWKNGSSGRAPA